ncbi:ArdC family protein [Trichlorobacter lovleyi]|uniref:ArdC family protein n=1 Tax=Trichlorobacter lovleyi TaxID=313985 RepID=UPI0024804792|nr:zincin-like metallopeptidase domain-containing protein [Trichlorobacter lovleyi]
MDVYEVVNKRIIELLEAGCCPWLKPWNAATNMPRNLITKREYSGINVWLLNAMNYSSSYFASYRQISERGGHVRKGEKANVVCFWKLVDRRQANDPDAEPNAAGKVPLLRYYNVFNVPDQTEGIEAPPVEETTNIFTPIDEAERIISEMPSRPIIQHKGNRAYYSVVTDMITLPPQQCFNSADEYYCTLNHEAIHSTMAEHRLNRKASIQVHTFGDEGYSREELVAEMGAAYLCAFAGIENTMPNSASYIQGWLKALKDDRKLLVIASAQAWKAANWILNRQHAEEASE